MQDTSFKNRNRLIGFILLYITFGVYFAYWFHSTLKELHRANGKPEGAALWTLLLFVPFGPLFSYWHHYQEYATFFGKNGVGTYILWILFWPAAWFIVQGRLNSEAS